jgi:hypothetical protein
MVAEADQRAAETLSARMPGLVSVGRDATNQVAELPSSSDPLRPTAPYESIASDFRGAIQCGVLQEGDLLPTMKEIGSPPRR